MRIQVLRIVLVVFWSRWAFREKFTTQPFVFTDHAYCLLQSSSKSISVDCAPFLQSLFLVFPSTLKDKLKPCSSPSTRMCLLFTEQRQANMNRLPSKKNTFLCFFLCVHPFFFPPFSVSDSFLHFPFSLLDFILGRWLSLLYKNFLFIYFLLKLPSSFNFPFLSFWPSPSHQSLDRFIVCWLPYCATESTCLKL